MQNHHTPGPERQDEWVIHRLRIEVGRLRDRQPRARFGTRVHLGRLGGSHHYLDLPPAPEARYGLHTVGEVCELLGHAWERTVDEAADGHVQGWIARAGTPQPRTCDGQWSAGLRQSAGLRGWRLSDFWVLTRGGWHDLERGTSAQWRRLRM